MENQKLERIAQKYSQRQYNEDNYYVGGGLSETGKKASKRHENAISDEGKLTFGAAAQMFKRATGEDVTLINEIFDLAVPYPEWHHAGFIPKQYGGGMKKTYFLNADEIVKIAENFYNYKEQLQIRKEQQKNELETQKNREEKQLSFLKKHAVKIERASEQPEYFYETNREMNGKYGWFESYGKSYKLPEYYTGWKFKSEEDMNEFFKI